MKNIIQTTLVVASGLLLSSCSLLSVQVPPDEGYMINQAVPVAKHSRASNSTLMVLQPDTAPAYNTVRIAFTDHPYELSYYSYHHWAEAPSDMFAPLLNDALQKTHHFRAIITPPFTGQYRYLLRTQIKELRIDFTKRFATMNVAVQAQLMFAASGNVIAAREFKTAVPLHHRTPYSGVVAANRATSIVLGEVTAWTVQHTR